MKRRERLARDDRARFMWGAFAAAVREHRRTDPRGAEPIANDIGITATDFSRAMGGKNIEAGKVIALCIWMHRNPLDFYLPASHVSRADCFTFTLVQTTENKQLSQNGGAV